MEVVLSTDKDTSNLSGTVVVTATVTPPGHATPLTDCKFYVDNVLKATDTSYPLTFSWDTTTLSDGDHVLKATVIAKRTKTSSPLPVKVTNTVTPPPPPPPPPPLPQAVPVNTVVPTISDTTPQEGQTISVVVGSWTNAPTSYTYQWRRCDGAGANCVAIPSATAAAYTCSDEDVDSTLRCSVTAHNAIGPSAPAQTAATTAVSALAPSVPVLVATPVISGSPMQGNTLAVSSGSWTNSPTSFTRQWKRCNASPVTSSINNGDTIISGQTWTVTTDVPCSVVEFYADGIKLGEDTSSPFTQVVTLADGARNLGIAITPVGGVRTELSDSGVNGRFAAVTVSAGPAVSTGAFGTVISGATVSTYVVAAADVGKTLRCLTTAVNATGSSTPVQSEETAVATAATPPDPPQQAHFVEDFEGTQPFSRWFYEPAYNPAYHKTVAGVSGNAIGLRTNEGSPGPNPTSNGSVIYLAANVYPLAGWEDALGGRTSTHDTWYRVRVKFPTGFVPGSGYQWTVEWHVDSETSLTGNHAYSSALGVTSSGQMYLRPGGGQQSSPTYRSHLVGAIVLNHWYDLVFHWRWHPSSSVGFYAMWKDGVVAVPQTSFATLYTNVSGNIGYNNFDLQNYHSISGADSEIHYDSVRIGRSAASVGFTP